MWPASHSLCSRTSRTCRPSRSRCPALVQLGDGHPLDAVDVELVLAPGGHAAGEVAGDVAQADRAGEVGGFDGVLVVAADEHDGLLGLGEPGELGAEPGAARGDGDGAGDVRLVELQLGAHVDDQRAVLVGLLDLARAQRDAPRRSP